MEIMEDGNLMDKVLILIQRDMEYYNSKQSVLQERICAGVVGGKLDFPRSASFAAVKLVLWWEDEFIAAYRKPSGFLGASGKPITPLATSEEDSAPVLKTSDPAKFIAAITKTSGQLLDHLHILTQEALDHADLTVLTGTIGAAALIKNAFWCYIQHADHEGGEQLQPRHKQYQAMGEALAERLLDLHTRLLSLYILQDADGLDWECARPFCESERGSYVVQMWWLYMRGTRDDLWNSVPPAMAQRVFAGMLNESLTILTVRYTHAVPSMARSQLYAVDLSNLLLCVAELLPAICDTADELLGVHLSAHNKMLRDIHSKCHELLGCLLLRGSTLEVLQKIFRKPTEQIQILKPKQQGANPWISFAMRHLHRDVVLTSTSNVVELVVLLQQPQPNWAQLLKIIGMDSCKVGKIILNVALAALKGQQVMEMKGSGRTPCGGFLCAADGSCKGVEPTLDSLLTVQHYHQLLYAFTYFVLKLGSVNEYESILLRFITDDPEWTQAFDKRHVWSQHRPAWYAAMHDLAAPLLPSIAAIVINAVNTGASMYQAASIVLVSFTQLWDCVMGPQLFAMATMIQDVLPANVVPMGNSVLLQCLISALYAELLETSRGSGEQKSGEIALAVAEALCGIDEDNKHTHEIEALMAEARRCAEANPVHPEGMQRIGSNASQLQMLVGALLDTQEGRRTLKVLHHFIKNNDEWLMGRLEGKTESLQPNVASKRPHGLLHTMFFIGNRPFDELLSGAWVPNWQQMFSVPMGMNADRIAGQLLSRWDLKHESNQEFAAHLAKTLVRQSSLT